MYSLKALTYVMQQVHYNPKLELVVGMDACTYGIGLVLSHKMPCGEEKPILF